MIDWREIQSYPNYINKYYTIYIFIAFKIHVFLFILKCNKLYYTRRNYVTDETMEKEW